MVLQHPPWVSGRLHRKDRTAEAGWQVASRHGMGEHAPHQDSQDQNAARLGRADERRRGRR